MERPLIGKRATIERRWKWCVPPLYLLCSPVFVDTHYRLSFVAEVVAVVTVVLSLPSIVALTRQAQLHVVLNTIGIESDCCC